MIQVMASCHPRITAAGDAHRMSLGRPCLDVRNPRASVLAEKVFAQGGKFWWSWAEPIAACDQIADPATILTRALSAVGDEVDAEP
jgi:hypothetical protein